jgi:hypothetical protein
MGGFWLPGVMMDLLKVINSSLTKVWTLISDPLNTKTKSSTRQRSATTDDLKISGRRSYKFDYGQKIFDQTPLQATWVRSPIFLGLILIIFCCHHR